MNIMQMKKRDFARVPWVSAPTETFDGLVVVPANEMHDSGFRCMEFVATSGNEPIFRFGGRSDVIHVDGVMGVGEWDFTKQFPARVNPKSWSIDMLPCGYLRIFCRGYQLKVSGACVSDLEVFAVHDV